MRYRGHPMRSWTLVTGASGFVGSRLVRFLLARGERVKALVRPSASLRQLEGLPTDRFQLAYGDILVGHTVYRALAGCAKMYHVASNFTWWDPHPQRVLAPAVEGTRAVLTAARQRGLERIVVTSSVAALGNTAKKEPFAEDHRFDLLQPEQYTQSKHDALVVTREMMDAGLPIVVVMPSVIGGPGDWKPTPMGQLFVRYLNSRVPLPVFEGGLSLTDVDDVAEGHWLAMERGRPGETYLLGGENLLFAELVQHLHEITRLTRPGPQLGATTLALAGWLLQTHARLLGGTPPLTYRMAKQQTGRYSWVTSEKAERELGYRWRPAHATLRRGVAWFARHGYVERAQDARRLRLELGEVD